MKDGSGREINYVRISVTDKCNLRCRYCMPRDIEHVDMKYILSFEEIGEIARCMAGLGISRIRLTGGEPLIRRGICDLVAMLKNTDGIRQVTMTTNGVLLEKNLPGLISAGIDGINVSIDTLDGNRYRDITGYDELDTVVRAVKAAVASGIKVKINAVTLDDISDAVSLIEFARDNKTDVRFIELMPIGFAKGYGSLGHDRLLAWFKENYPQAAKCDEKGNGPARYYSVPGYSGKIGFISALSNRFCDDCNRIRLTTKGFLKGCLCYDTGEDLMPIIRSDAPEREKYDRLVNAIETVIAQKPSGHDFAHVENVSENLPMSAIGG